jgi:hypothetical protein
MGSFWATTAKCTSPTKVQPKAVDHAQIFFTC